MAIGLDADMRIEHDKLVRDRVVDAIIADGHTCKVERLSPERYLIELKRKLVEESREVLAAETRDDVVAELADVAEVILAMIAVIGVCEEDVELERRARFARRGGFTERVFLQFVDTRQAQP